MRLVVDTNIIISALIRDSLTRKALLYPHFEFFALEDICIRFIPQSLANKFQSLPPPDPQHPQGVSINTPSTITVS